MNTFYSSCKFFFCVGWKRKIDWIPCSKQSSSYLIHMEPFHGLWNPRSIQRVLVRAPRITADASRETSGWLAGLLNESIEGDPRTSHPGQAPSPSPSPQAALLTPSSRLSERSSLGNSGAPGTVDFWCLGLGKQKSMQFKTFISVCIPTILISQWGQWTLAWGQWGQLTQWDQWTWSCMRKIEGTNEKITSSYLKRYCTTT